MVGLVRHRQTKGPATDRPYLNHRATLRLHTRSAKSGATPSESVHAIAESTLHWRFKMRRAGRVLPRRVRREFCSAVGSGTPRSRVSRAPVVGRKVAPLCRFDKKARALMGVNGLGFPTA